MGSKTFLDPPMKASDYVEAKLRFPYIASPKLDGYRAFVYEGKIRTSSGTPVLNHYTRNLFSSKDFEGLDGELLVGAPFDKNAYHNTSGPVRKATGEPDVKWYVFDDRTSPRVPFVDRVAGARRRVEASGHPSLVWLPQTVVETLDEMLAFEQECVELGYEGIMLRDPNGPYKFGRSSVTENWLLKVKRFISEEATIVSLEEQVTNLGEAEVNAYGRAKRSVSKDMQIGVGMVGSFVVESPRWPSQFRIAATSLSHVDRKAAWENPTMYIGQLAKFKYFPHGVVDAPRHGVFEGLRGREDL